MVTHRSLNKLERRAYMSIHNMAEVPEAEKPRETSTTRDRFGKMHGIPKIASDKKPKSLRRSIASALLFFLLSLTAFLPLSFAGEVRKGPNVTIDSSEVEPFGPAPGKDSDRFVFYEDEKMVFGVNDDAQADVGMPF